MKMNVLLDIMTVTCLPHVTTLLVITLVSAMKAEREMESIAQVMNYFYKRSHSKHVASSFLFFGIDIISKRY